MQKQKPHLKTIVKKLLKNIENIDILFCLIDIKRYFKNIDILISYQCHIDISTSLQGRRYSIKVMLV